MTEKENKHLYALVGRNISYSFSRGYFTEKFKKLDLEDHKYINFDIQSIHELPQKIKENKKRLKGMNVTIPYKLEVFNFLESIFETEIIAINSSQVSFTRFLYPYFIEHHLLNFLLHQQCCIDLFLLTTLKQL